MGLIWIVWYKHKKYGTKIKSVGPFPSLLKPEFLYMSMQDLLSLEISKLISNNHRSCIDIYKNSGFNTMGSHGRVDIEGYGSFDQH